MSRFPRLRANIAKCLITSSWRFAVHIIASFRSFYRFFTKRTYFCIDQNPFYIGFILFDFIKPFLNHITGHRSMNFISASKTKHLSTFAMHFFWWSVRHLNEVLAIKSRARCDVSIFLHKFTAQRRYIAIKSSQGIMCNVLNEWIRKSTSALIHHTSHKWLFKISCLFLYHVHPTQIFYLDLPILAKQVPTL